MADTGAASAPAPAREARQSRGPARARTSDGLPLKSPRVIASVVVLAGTTLAAEVYLPAGVWAAALHLAIVFLGLWLARPREVYGLAAVASGLVVAGAVLTASGASPAAAVAALLAGPDLANRLMVLLAIWALAAAIAESKRREAALRTGLAKEMARRQASEAELETRHGVPRPAALDERVWDSQDLGHEVRTLLNAILGFSEAAKGEIFGPIADARYRDYMACINKSGWTLLRVFEQHLAAEPLPENRTDPGTRRDPGPSAPAADKTTAAKAINK